MPNTRFEFRGIGIHSGIPTRIFVEPSDQPGPVQFHTPTGIIPATPQSINHITSRATTMQHKNATVQTVEHLLFAIHFFFQSANVYVDGPEIPIMDGSALPFMKAFLKEYQLLSPNFFTVGKPLNIDVGRSVAQIVPCVTDEIPEYTVALEYANNAIGYPVYTYHPSTSDPFVELAPARTFALESEVQNLHAASLALGGSLKNALVIGGTGPLNPEGMRFPNEPARHKMLDLMGDLFVLDALPFAHIHVTQPGHQINHQICYRLASMLTD